MVKRFTKSVLEKSKFHAAWHRFPRKPHTKMITRNYSLTPWNPLQFLNYWGAPFCFTLACLARAWGLCSTTICAFRAGGGLSQTAYTYKQFALERPSGFCTPGPRVAGCIKMGWIKMGWMKVGWIKVGWSRWARFARSCSDLWKACVLTPKSVPKKQKFRFFRRRFCEALHHVAKRFTT